MSSETWWYLARASGFVAWLAALASLLFGMALSTHALGRRPRRPWLLDLHRYLGGLCVAFVGLHLVALLADDFVQFSIADLLVPFVTSYRTTAVAWGVLAFWLVIAVEVSSLVMHRLPRKVWYGIHLSSYVIAVTATLHALYTGTDTSNPAFRWTGLVALGLVGFFTIYRVLAPAESRGRNSTGANARRYAAHLQPQGPQPPDWL
ncbi:MAG TPA: ferric reductase-like transmembrane domain-containing protein [Acidimicrobiales bacterium]|nr:ferric reductase-like transmembrane domain-containing protein [Acidimicrobiales bacterium]